MTHHAHPNAASEAVQLLAEQGFDGMAQLMQLLLNECMLIERRQTIGAAPYERSEARRGQANGFKPKTLKTRVGPLQLAVPQVRGASFYPSVLERGSRSEKALLLALAEMYVQGVSTARVSKITEELCGCEISSSDVSRATALLDKEFIAWRTRPLGAIEYLILDARNRILAAVHGAYTLSREAWDPFTELDNRYYESLESADGGFGRAADELAARFMAD